MTTTATVPPIRRPLSERINLRILTFVAVFGFLVGYPAYTYIDHALSGGIKDHGKYVEVDLKAMSTFPFDQEVGTISDVPAKWRELDGKTVQMVGEVAPDSQKATGAGHKFDLVYSVAKCCYNGTPQVQHFVKVTVPSNSTVDVKDEPGAWIVQGKLKIDVTRDPETGKINAIYHVTADSVRSV